MTELQVVELMRDLIVRFGGREEPKKETTTNRSYTRFQIREWNNNLNKFPGFLSIRSLTTQASGAGLKGKEPRLSRKDFSEIFSIPIESLMHRTWGQGRFRTSVGIEYKLVDSDSMRRILEWSLTTHGKKSDESRHLSEKLCMELLDEIFEARGEKDCTPTWLHEGNRGNLRLDGYWKCLQLAAEFHGPQHYVTVPYFHRGDPNALKKQRARDQKKRDACEKAGVRLIEIPYTVVLTKAALILFLRNNFSGISDSVASCRDTAK